MARYIKANQKVTQYLKLENDRNQVKDGNYLLWQNDMLAFGRLTELPHILEQIGAILLAAHEAKEEQDGTVTRELPVATDPRFIIETETADEEQAANDQPTAEESEPATETDAGQQSEAEDPETTEIAETTNNE